LAILGINGRGIVDTISNRAINAGIYELEKMVYGGLSWGLDKPQRSWDLQRSYNFSVLFPSTISGMDGTKISEYCQSVSPSLYNIVDEGKLKYGSKQRFYAGMQSIERTGFMFLNPTDNSVIKYFMGWFNLIIDEDGYYHPKNDYAKDVYVLAYGQDGKETIRIRLKGCWPINRPKLELAYSKEEMTAYSVSLAVDDVEMNYGNAVAQTPTSPIQNILTNIVKDVINVGPIINVGGI
jgi:hypothetical protein